MTTLSFTVLTRIECSGEARFMAEIAQVAENHGAALHTWESGQFGISNPVYACDSSRSGAFIQALRDRDYLTSFQGTKL